MARIKHTTLKSARGKVPRNHQIATAAAHSVKEKNSTSTKRTRKSASGKISIAATVTHSVKEKNSTKYTRKSANRSVKVKKSRPKNAIMSGNKKRRKATGASNLPTSCCGLEEAEEAIVTSKDVKECQLIVRELERLLQKAKTTVTSLAATSGNGTCYLCSKNTTKQSKVGNHKCLDCGKSMCEGCSFTCGCCGTVACNKCSEECTRCCDITCNSCINGVGYGNSSYCNGCYDEALERC